MAGNSSPPARNPASPQPHERLLSRMRHDLRTPISAILGYSELLAENVIGEISEPQRDVVRRIGGCALELEQMVDALVTLMRIELRVLPGERMTERAGNLARRVAEYYANRPNALTVRVEVLSDGDIRTDPRAAAELLEALLVSLGIHGFPGSATITVEAMDGEASFSISSDSALPEDFWETGEGLLAAEVAYSLVTSLGGTLRLAEDEAVVTLHDPG
jgi:K+-sensing histidine kinase KdpD